MQVNRLPEHVGAVSQPTGTESEPTSLCRGLTSELEMVTELPLEGPAGVTPECSATGRGVIVVGVGEDPAQGEGPQESSRNGELGDDTPTEERRILLVPEMQKRLAEKAVQDPDHRFGGLYDLLLREEILRAATTRLLGNEGSRTPGLDGIERDALKRNQDYHLAKVKGQLASGTFPPMPVKRVSIPKRNGKMRPLGIPTLYDRWVQMAVKIVIEPIFESDFATISHGFRPKRSCHTAIAHMYNASAHPKRKYYWAIEGDIEGFFDHVHHKKLMNLLRVRIRDQRMLDLIWSFLKAGVMEGQLFKKTEEGTPQGGVLSPLLANIYLNHFDQWFLQRSHVGEKGHWRENNRKSGHANFWMVRYADDFVVFSNGTKEETEAFKSEMKEWLDKELKLTLCEEKTAVTHTTDGFDFLGFTFRRKKQEATCKELLYSYPSTESVNRAVRRISDLTDRRQLLKSPEDQIEALNTFLRGWGEYFRHSAAKSTLRYIGSRAYMRMWKWLVMKSGARHGWQEAKEKYGHDNTWRAGRHVLMKVGYMKIEYPCHRVIPNPYLTGEVVTEHRHYDPFLTEWTGVNEYGEDWTTQREAARERAQGICEVCGSDKSVEIHHVKARRKGGTSYLSNLIALCRPCHRQSEIPTSRVYYRIREILAELDSGEPDALKGARPVRGGER
jgi:RNA-directed DNA polymerase